MCSNSTVCALALLVVVWVSPSRTWGEEPTAAQPAPASGYAVSELVNVVGSAEAIVHIPGSAHIIGKEELEVQSHDDIHRILQSIPGINAQEEDGYGLRPNIGMRGTGVERSQKITLMEDGVLIAPAPYSAPAAYYFPTPGRMEGIEVRKGSAAIKQGPYTNGGALNMVSAAIPSSWSTRLDGATGSDSAYRLQGLVGDSSERFGWMLQTYQLDTGGFKRLDGGGETGTKLHDYLGKVRFSSGVSASLHQTLELKLGRTDQVGNETYLGLTEADFAADPLRRYRGSQLDAIDSEHEQIHLRHFAVPGGNVDVVTTVYDNRFYRDWFKNENVAGVSNASVLADPVSYVRELGILRGETDSGPRDLRLRHNRRDYASRGVASIFGLGALAGTVDHRLEVGVRFHEDREDRFQEEDLYGMLGGRMVLGELGVAGSQSNRVGEARAVALFVQDRIAWGRFSLLPGIRYESIRHRRLDYSTRDPRRVAGPTRLRENKVRALMPGLGLALELGGGHGLVAGVHRGFSPPGTGSTEDVEVERSTNYELGYRFFGDGFRAEAIGFVNDYDNLLGAETVAGGGTADGELFNGGAVKVRGVEALVGYRHRAGSLTVPLNLSYTYTEGKFRTSFLTSFADWAPRVEVGDRLPYIPKHQLRLASGVSGRKWSVNLAGSYVAAMRTRAGQGPIPAGEGTDSRLVVDVGARYQLLVRLDLYANVRNLTDDGYIVARRPYGLRPGLPRTVIAGVSFDL
ncbi:MAG: TonB-dependent receptor [Acidobacteriota bacterium]|nr:TonB-dependent receptor [Acidobacteriota bacterium]